jgi:hypothetical protein
LLILDVFLVNDHLVKKSSVRLNPGRQFFRALTVVYLVFGAAQHVAAQTPFVTTWRVDDISAPFGSYSYNRSISIPAVDLRDDLVNFPLLVSLDIDQSHVVEHDKDRPISFVDAADADLGHELESFNSANGPPLAIGIVYGNVNPNPEFPGVSVYDDSQRTTDIAAVDLNGDGHMDFVKASSMGADKFAWFKNDGNQNYTAHEISSSEIRRFSVIDLDDDDDLDIVTVKAGPSSSLMWFENLENQNFTSHTISTNFNELYGIFVMDFDKDNNIDILTSSVSDNKLAWFKNDGSENFIEKEINTGVFSSYTLVGIDFDQDGDNDVVTLSETTDQFVWLENDGTMSFTSHEIAGGYDRPWTLDVSDIDGDGDWDVVGTARTDDIVAWFENDGSMGFTSHDISTTAQLPYDVITVDLDNDGDMDIVSANFDDSEFVWYRNDGSENFTGIIVNDFISQPYCLDIADMDMDGDKDILFGPYGSKNIEIGYSNLFDPACNGSSITFSEVGGVATSWSWSSSGSATFNPNSSEQSPVVSNFADGEVFTVIIDDGSGNSSTMSIHMASTDIPTIAVEPIEECLPLELTFNNVPDGVYDINHSTGTFNDVEIVSGKGFITANPGFYEDLSITVGNCTSTDDPDADITTPTPGIAVASVSDPESCDANGTIELTLVNVSDGSFEIDHKEGFFEVEVNANTATINAPAGVYENLSITVGECTSTENPSATLVNPPGSPAGIVYGVPNSPPTFAKLQVDNSNVESPQEAHTADIDGDGDNDIVSVSRSVDNAVHWHENDGQENFTTQIIAGTINNPSTLAIGDIDGDNDLDLAVGGRDDIVWYRNEGGGSFTPIPVYNEAGLTFNSIYIIDFNGDGTIDIVSGADSDDKIIVHANDGFESFTHTTVSTASTYYFDIADVNLDGHLDLVYSDNSAREHVWLENTGNSIDFITHKIARSSNSTPYSLVAGDIDLDGDIDLLNATYGPGNGVFWYENDGNENFTEHPFGTSYFYHADLVDLDNDGDLDVVALKSSNYYGYLNDGTGVFTDLDIPGSFSQPNAASFGDVDRDGDQDIITSEISGNNVSWLENSLLISDCPGVSIVFDEIGDKGKAWSWSTDGVATFNNAALKSPIISNLSNGELVSVDVTDEKGCVTTAEAYVKLKPQPTISATNPGVCDPLEVTFTNVPDGIYDIDYDGGTWPDIEVESGSASFSVSNGTYNDLSITVDGCTSLDDPDVTVDDGPPGIFVDNVVPAATCGGNGTINLSFNNVPNETYTIGYDAGSFDIEVLGGTASIPAPAGLYENLSITLINGCTSNESPNVLVNEPVPLPPAINYGTPTALPSFVKETKAYDADDGFEYIVVEDLDQDGWLDMIVSSQDGAIGISWYKNNGDGTFTANQISNFNNTSKIVVVDFDKDGNMDVAYSIGEEIRLHQNDGNENFTITTRSTSLSNIDDFLAVDVDSDGDNDWVAVSSSSKKVIWLENNGLAFTEYPTTADALSLPFTIAAFDIDRDGDTDLFAGDYTDGAIYWYENDGSQNFTRVIIAAPNGIQHMDPVDMDRDGDIDIVAAADAENKVMWYENNGTTSFIAHTIDPSVNSPYYAYAVDFDNDGDMDAYCVDGSSESIFWYENDGSQSFTEHTLDPDADVVRHAAFGDLDNDGDIDLAQAAGDFRGGFLSVHYRVLLKTGFSILDISGAIFFDHSGCIQV